jgi:hypothetical protein
MLMTVYTLNKEEKEMWCEKVRTVRGKSGIPGKSGYSGKNPDSPGFQNTGDKQHSSKIFNLAYNILKE